MLIKKDIILENIKTMSPRKNMILNVDLNKTDTSPEKNTPKKNLATPVKNKNIDLNEESEEISFDSEVDLFNKPYED